MHMKYWLHGTISFAREWVTFGDYFTGNGASHTNQCWCQKTRVIAVSCGIKISTYSFGLVTIHASDRQTDGRTDGRTDWQTDRQNCDNNTVRCITCTVKRGIFKHNATNYQLQISKWVSVHCLNQYIIRHFTGFAGSNTPYNSDRIQINKQPH